MTLDEATKQFLNKECDIHWGPLDRPARKNESFPSPTRVVVSEIFLTCYGDIMFRCTDRIYTPFSVQRLKTVHNPLDT